MSEVGAKHSKKDENEKQKTLDWKWSTR